MGRPRGSRSGAAGRSLRGGPGALPAPGTRRRLRSSLRRPPPPPRSPSQRRGGGGGGGGDPAPQISCSAAAARAAPGPRGLRVSPRASCAPGGDGGDGGAPRRAAGGRPGRCGVAAAAAAGSARAPRLPGGECARGCADRGPPANPCGWPCARGGPSWPETHRLGRRRGKEGPRPGAGSGAGSLPARELARCRRLGESATPAIGPPRGGPSPAQLGEQVGSSLGLPLGKRTSRVSVPAGGDGDRARCVKAG